MSAETTREYVPWASTPGVRRVMQGNRKRDTRPEVFLRQAVHALGLRYRVATRPLAKRPWTADLVFPSERVAVFLDGCYWHGCPQHYAAPRTNPEYWLPKVDRNRRRDVLVDEELRTAGWTSLRIWEHEPAAEAAARVATTVRRARLGR